MRPLLSALAVAVTIVAGGCSDSLGPQSIAGTWSESFTIPGNSFVMQLTVAGSDVSGIAHGCGEAGTCASSVITGASDGTGVHLDIASTSDASPQTVTISFFDGTFVNRNTLRGTLVYLVPPDAADSQITFTRQ